MKKINIKPYEVEAEAFQERRVLKGLLSVPEIVEVLEEKWGKERATILVGQYQKIAKYPTKQVLSGTIFNTQLKLGNEEVLARAELRKKILECKKDELLLEEAEYQIIRNSFAQIKGFTLTDVEMCRRVRDAKTVEKVKEDK